MSLEELKALAAVKKKPAESQTKLAGYRQTLQKAHGDKLRLRAYSVVAVSYECLAWREVI